MCTPLGSIDGVWSSFDNLGLLTLKGDRSPERLFFSTQNRDRFWAERDRITCFSIQFCVLSTILEILTFFRLLFGLLLVVVFLLGVEYSRVFDCRFFTTVVQNFVFPDERASQVLPTISQFLPSDSMQHGATKRRLRCMNAPSPLVPTCRRRL